MSLLKKHNSQDKTIWNHCLKSNENSKHTQPFGKDINTTRTGVRLHIFKRTENMKS